MSRTADELLSRVSAAARSLLATGVGPRWIAAVSGGADSVAMLCLLRRVSEGLGIELSVAHLDHGTRGEAGREDGRFTERLAKKLGLSFDLGEWAPPRSSHFEADARGARYDWLASVARERGASAVAVAHTRDDQAETILHRILRGTGPDGLAGMSASRPIAPGIALVRPLLSIRRADLVAFLEETGQNHRVDASNTDHARTRNRIRGDLMPKLAAEYNPEIVEALARLGDLCRPSEDDRETRRRRALELVVEAGDASVELDRERLASLSSFERAERLRFIWRDLGFAEGSMTSDHWKRLADWVDRDSGRIELPGGYAAQSFPDRLVLSRRGTAPPTPVEAPVHIELDRIARAFGRSFRIGTATASTEGERIDADRVAPPLILDRPRPGDRFEPLGLAGRSQALADFLRGRGLDAEARRDEIVLRDTRGIVWVVGRRISDRVKLTESTKRVLSLEVLGNLGTGDSGCG